MTTAWVLGSGGLLGSALCRALRIDGTDLFSPVERFHWNSESAVIQQVKLAVREFATRATNSQQWEIYWAAGAGTMGSLETDLAPETRILTFLLQSLASSPQLVSKPGAVAFASSAGAIYAGSPDYTISEETPPAPTTAYAYEKLRQEDLIRSFMEASDDQVALLTRLSTIYGIGQSLSKQQGLLTHIARCILRNKPIQIYVPLDTIRDYINADDAAISIIAALRAIRQRHRGLTKIIASEQPTTIAEIISIFKRITRHAPRIITSASRLTSVYSRRVQFRSTVAPQCTALGRTSLLTGIAMVMAAERMAFIRSLNQANHQGDS